MKMSADDYNRAIARRFGTEFTKTLLVSTVAAEPIAASQIILPMPTGRWTLKPVDEAAFSIHVAMAPLSKLRARIGGRRGDLVSLRPGEIGLFDLSTSPVALFEAPAENVRFHITKHALDELCYECGRRRVAGLRHTLGEKDPVLHHVSQAFVSWYEYYGTNNLLFLEYLVMAFHAHIIRTYGQDYGTVRMRGGLAAWQLRNVRDFMTAKLAEKITTADLAEICGLSKSQFNYAFRQSMGTPPHKWLMRARVEQAKSLLREGVLDLRDVALACGFSDQSHLSRVFSFQEGISPGRWKRLCRG